MRHPCEKEEEDAASRGGSEEDEEESASWYQNALPNAPQLPHGSAPLHSRRTAISWVRAAEELRRARLHTPPCSSSPWRPVRDRSAALTPGPLDFLNALPAPKSPNTTWRLAHGAQAPRIRNCDIRCSPGRALRLHSKTSPSWREAGMIRVSSCKAAGRHQRVGMLRPQDTPPRLERLPHDPCGL